MCNHLTHVFMKVPGVSGPESATEYMRVCEEHLPLLHPCWERDTPAQERADSSVAFTLFLECDLCLFVDGEFPARYQDLKNSFNSLF